MIVSIPHTGSRFLRERLGIDEIVHTELSWPELMSKTAGKKLVSPLRTPKACLISALRRIPPELPFDVAAWVHCWYIMHSLTMTRSVEFIVLEDQSDPRITDWSPVGHDDDDNGRPMYESRAIADYISLTKIHDLPFVRSRYGRMK